MNSKLKIAYCVLVFGLLAIPLLSFLGFKEDWVKLAGWERQTKVPALSMESFTNRTYQAAFTEDFSKRFYLRRTFLRTAYELRDWFNFGQFHYGYANSILEGREGVLFERPYADYHLTCPRPGGAAKYAEVLKTLGEINAFCTSNGVDFVCLLLPDKLQLYPEYLPRWMNWFWDYSNYEAQAELAEHLEKAGIKAFDMNKYLLAKKESWETWVYPPGGTHFNAYGSGLIYNGFLEKYVDSGILDFKANRFKGVERIAETWSVDDDIGLLLNTWRLPHVKDNPHYRPLFESDTNTVMNAGSLVLFGDCYRGQVAQIFKDAHFFEPSKIYQAQRHGEQKPEGFKNVVGDLRMVFMTFQSFNTGRLDERNEEIQGIFKALKTAYAAAHGRPAASRP